MTPTQKIQLRMSEKREELRNLGMFTDDDKDKVVTATRLNDELKLA